MDLLELNNTMLFFDNDYIVSKTKSIINTSTNEQQLPVHSNDINFIPPANVHKLITSQIKRPVKSEGEYRDSINEKLSNMNMSLPTPIIYNNSSTNSTNSTHTQFTRNNDYQQNEYQQTEYKNPDNHQTDARQHINTKIDRFIFDNPVAHMNANMNANMNSSMNASMNASMKDTRMVIQDSSKDYYRQTSNNRISQYSLLARSSNIPIALANMSVNDFYANMNIPKFTQTTNPQQQQQPQPDTINKNCNNVFYSEFPVMSNK